MAVTGAIVAVGAAAAYNQNQKNKAGKNAMNHQVQGVDNARAEIDAAYGKARGNLQQINDKGMWAENGVRQGITTAQGQLQTGARTLAGQQGALNVSEFYDPSMAFQMQEGQKAIQASAAARGGMMSGAALKELTKYSTGLAATNYNNAVQQALASRGQQIDIGRTQSNIGLAGLSAGQHLYDQGLQSYGDMARLDAQQGQDNANLEMTRENVMAARDANYRNALGTGVAASASTWGGNYLGGYASSAGKAAGSNFSDERLKEEVSKITDADIDDFLSIEPYEFEYTEEAKEKGAPEGKKAGVMAQDLEKTKIGKTLVHEDEDGHKMVDVKSTVGALLASASALDKRIKKLEGKK